MQFTRPDGAADYVNSMWEIQSEPYKGDALNSYNDGPPGPGQKPLGPFYELESSSPALALEPGQQLYARPSHVPPDRAGSESRFDRAQGAQGRAPGHHGAFAQNSSFSARRCGA